LFSASSARIQSIFAIQALTIAKQACAAEIAVLYAALTCKQNKIYRTSARLTKTRDRCFNVNMNATDGQTDRQSATQYAAPSYGGGPHKNATRFDYGSTLQCFDAVG